MLLTSVQALGYPLHVGRLRLSHALASAPRTVVTRAVPPVGCSTDVHGPKLDRAAFEQTRPVVAVAVDAASCSEVMHALRPHLLKLRGVKPVRYDGERRLVLLEAPPPLPAALQPVVQGVAQRVGGTLEECSVVIGYEHLTATEALRQLLPAHVEAPSAFEQVGHVAHVNLREEQLPYKALIGRVLLDKNAPKIRTVVNKLASITDEYRVFPMEVLAGDASLETAVKENGATFRLDFSRVYWNSRLETEHRRVVEQLRPDDVVCDMMAGVGPFAVPAARRGCRVYANDLNPQSARWLRANVAGNKVGERVAVSRLDARAFVRALLGAPQPTPTPTSTPAPMPAPAPAPAPPSLATDPPRPRTPSPSPPPPPTDDAEPHGEEAEEEDGDSSSSSSSPPVLRYGPFSHVIMNLPAAAPEFLDAFVGAFDRRSWGDAPLPRCHCYCFSSAADDPAAEAIARAEGVLGCALPGATAHLVRDVSPARVMMCVEFVLPDAVAWRRTDESEEVGS